MSADLMQQLKACSLKLGVCAETLQQRIKEKCNKNKHYIKVIEEATNLKRSFQYIISNQYYSMQMIETS